MLTGLVSLSLSISHSLKLRLRCPHVFPTDLLTYEIVAA